MELIREFKDLNKNDTEIAGGKGASLGEMTQAGIPVPGGFVILSEAFERFLEETDLGVEIDAILRTVNKDEMRSVEHASEKIQSLILRAEMPKDIASIVQDSFETLDTKYVAVRSSATAEDSSSAAWAGQLESFLNTTETNLFEKVQQCWASLFTARAIFYRFEKELHATKISVAVVVQKMVNSEISGIAFSVHPVTEDRNQLIIEAGLGLGEAIVSGSVTPDNYVVKKDTKEVMDVNISTQTKAMYRVDGGGNEWKDLPEPQASAQVLTKKQILELSELIIKIEDHYGFPCDIEWAWENGEFYIVQSRPITTLKNTAGTSVWYGKFNWKSVAKDFNSPFFRNYIWVNSASIYKNELNLPKLVIGIKSEGDKIEYFAHLDSWSAAHDALKQRVEEDFKYIERELIDKTNELGEAFNSWSEREIFEQDLSQKNNQELIGLYSIFFEKQSRMYAYGITLPTLDLGDFAYIEGNLEKILKEKFLPEQYQKYYALFTEPAYFSFAQEQEMDLLRLIKKYYSESWKNEVLTLEIDILKKKHSVFWDNLLEHTKKYAWVYYVYVGPAFSEKEFFNFIIQELKTDELPGDKLKRITEKQQNIIKEKESIISSCKFSDFEENILRLAGKVVWAKPRRKDYQSKSFFHVEKLQREIAVRLTITLDQVRSAHINVLSTGLKEGVVDTSLLDSIKSLHVVLPKEDDTIDLFYGEEAKNFVEKYSSRESDVEDINKKNISGNVAYKGFVRGVVKVINTPEEMSKMNDGDVLVSVATTPSIVPVMKLASAIVTDEGGLTCHAAIVSRELETPCVVGTKIATQVLKDGDKVEVDADNGVVRIIEN